MEPFECPTSQTPGPLSVGVPLLSPLLPLLFRTLPNLQVGGGLGSTRSCLLSGTGAAVLTEVEPFLPHLHLPYSRRASFPKGAGGPLCLKAPSAGHRQKAVGEGGSQFMIVGGKLSEREGKGCFCLMQSPDLVTLKVSSLAYPTFYPHPLFISNLRTGSKDSFPLPIRAEMLRAGQTASQSLQSASNSHG